MTKKPDILLLAALLLLTALALFFSLKRDLKNITDKYAASDLHKRIVGARYQKAGLSPYFFKWKQGMPEELCNPDETDSTIRQNVVTLAPSYTWLLQPLSQLKFQKIEKIWMGIQYLMLFCIVLIFFYKAENTYQQCMILLAFSLFLFSAGWIVTADMGQQYILFPFLWSLPFIFKESSTKFYTISAVCLALCIWLKPTCILLALPFCILNRKKEFWLPLLITSLILVLQPFIFDQVKNWKDYFTSSSLWVDYYADYNNASKNYYSDNMPNVVEGGVYHIQIPLNDYNANIPLNLIYFFNRALPKNFWYCSVAAVILLASARLLKMKTASSLFIWLSAFLFYYAGEVLIPIAKLSYYHNEFIFPVLLILSNSKNVRVPLVWLIVFSLFLSAYFFKLIPLQLLFAEYLAAAVFFWLFLKYNNRNPLI